MSDPSKPDCAATSTHCGSNHAGMAIELLNEQCFCISLQEGALEQALQDELTLPGAENIFALISERCPHLFSARPVFISSSQAERIAQVVQAIESVVALPAYRAAVLDYAPEIARHTPRGARGVFFGYDFHVNAERIALIEINTNAGGAMLNALLARAQHACCAVMQDIVFDTATAQAFEAEIVAMFLHEWQLAEQDRPLRSIAIVDEAPQQQYLYPEFLLFQQLFQRQGWQAVIVAPAELEWRDGYLWHGELQIDLVYNRLTDFLLEAPASAALRSAYLADAVLLTPHPQAHALYADKRNLALLSDAQRLQELGVAPEVQKILLENIPHTEQVKPEHAERLWAQRRHLFFKPHAGYGGRAAYRGDKLTKRVWEEILAGEYIAQAIVAPGERVTGSIQQPAQLKFDLRFYTYQGKVQWSAARTYQGQTTNFRTPGGGFAPVYSIPDERLLAGVAHISGLLEQQA
ncbi:hypothetical protein [Undibacterium sp. Ren11W]|uniref:hypothetical protein n=1 Tax=Undibacterium sp. Ren11W TaxID=3413045 RepID=UPI003BF0BFC4